jgi:hypothetical protein
MIAVRHDGRLVLDHMNKKLFSNRSLSFCSRGTEHAPAATLGRHIVKIVAVLPELARVISAICE